VCCIITDVQMRQMSGFGLLQYLKGSNCAIPVIIITGNPSEKSAAFYLENGAAGFFQKPVDHNALFRAAKYTVPLDRKPEFGSGNSSIDQP
jgi:FixJ family two-component response regulator